jgi:hypothetical protein
MPRNEIDLAEFAAQRREAELDADQCEWAPAPQPGEFALNADLAAKTGLEFATADEFSELLLAAKGLGSLRKAIRHGVRPHVLACIADMNRMHRMQTTKEAK